MINEEKEDVDCEFYLQDDDVCFLRNIKSCTR